MKNLLALAAVGILAVGVAAAHPVRLASVGLSAPATTHVVTPAPDLFGSILVDR